MKRTFIFFIPMLLMAVFAAQALANDINLFSSDFFHGTEEYRMTKRGKEENTKSHTIINRENGNHIITTRQENEIQIIELRQDLTPLKATLESRNKIVTEIDYNEDKIVMKKNGKLFKSITRKSDELYLQRESLELVLRGYNFEHVKRLNFHLLSLDLDSYFMELSLVGKEKITTGMGDFTCYKLLMMPAGAGKIFASKYKNYYYFTEDPPHYYIKYYNDFLPLVSEIETHSLIGQKL